MVSSSAPVNPFDRTHQRANASSNANASLSRPAGADGGGLDGDAGVSMSMDILDTDNCSSRMDGMNGMVDGRTRGNEFRQYRQLANGVTCRPKLNLDPQTAMP